MARYCGRRCDWIVVTALVVALLVYNLVWVVPVRCPWIEVSLVEHVSAAKSSRDSKSDDDPLSRLDLRLGRWDASRNLRIFDYAVVGGVYLELSGSRSVCLATQSSIETFKEILNTLAHWSGPISAAVYVAADEMQILRGFVTWLYNCESDAYSRLALHIVTPKENPAQIGAMPHWARDCSTKPLLAEQRLKETIAWRAKHPYPQNVLRNLARKNCHTQYVYMVDIDIVPCKGMADSLEKFLSTAKCSKCAYVIPTYELDWNVTRFPEDKAELLSLVKRGKSVAYHSKIFRANQQSSDLTKWASLKDVGLPVHVSHNVSKYKILYEPFYVAQDSVPPHDERFVGYGFTRNSQVYEMYLQEYQFKVLSPLFTIHWGLQPTKRPKWRMKEIWKNNIKFKKFQKELFARYGKDPLHLFTNKNGTVKKQKKSSKS